MSSIITYRFESRFSASWIDFQNTGYSRNIIRNIINEIIFQKLGENIRDFKIIIKDEEFNQGLHNNRNSFTILIKGISKDNINKLHNIHLNYRDKKLLIDHWRTVLNEYILSNKSETNLLQRFVQSLLDEITSGEIIVS